MLRGLFDRTQILTISAWALRDLLSTWKMPCPTTPKPKRPILILFMSWMDERVEDSVQLFVLDQKPVVSEGESIWW